MIKFLKTRDLASILIVLAAVGIVFPITHATIASIGASDYQWHMNASQDLIANGRFVVPHFLWHLLVRGIRALTGVSVPFAAELVTLLAQASVSFAILLTIDGRHVFDRSTADTQSIRAIVTLILVIAAPVFALAPFDGQDYLGYIAITSYHNPTIAILRPIALVHFWMVVRHGIAGRISVRVMALTAALTVLSILAKPNYIICVAPALALYGIGATVTRKAFDWRWYFVAIATPAFATFTWQYLVAFAPGSENGIVLAPLAVMQGYSNHLALKFLLSILFPLSIVVFFPQSIVRDPGLVLAWIAFIGGCCLTYLFAESGPRFAAGNFLWSGQITLFILFVWSAAFLFTKYREVADKPELRVIAASIALGLHGIAGTVFYGREWLHIQVM